MSDFEGYARADIPCQRVYALQRLGAGHCQPGAWVACLPEWAPHLQALAAAREP